VLREQKESGAEVIRFERLLEDGDGAEVLRFGAKLESANALIRMTGGCGPLAGNSWST
jgi:hypothetical protein